MAAPTSNEPWTSKWRLCSWCALGLAASTYFEMRCNKLSYTATELAQQRPHPLLYSSATEAFKTEFLPEKNATNVQSIWHREANDAWCQMVSSDDGKQGCKHDQSVADKLQPHSQPTETTSHLHSTRVQKNPFFLKKAQPGWVFLGFIGFWVLLGFFGRAVPAAVRKHGKGK